MESKGQVFTNEHRFASLVKDSRLYRCNTCKLVFRYPTLDNDQLARLYQALPSDRWAYVPESVESWSMVRSWLLRNCRKDKSLLVLDVGAYRGTFLKSLPNSWTKLAIEPAAAAAVELESAGIKRVSKYVETPPDHYDGKVDIVTMFDVFEHLSSPANALKAIHKMLRPNGILLLSTGNSAHWTWRLLCGQHWYLHTLQHLCFGCPNYFRKVAENLGFKVRFIRPHAHRSGNACQRIRQAIATIHYAARHGNRVLYYIAAVWQRLPGFRWLIHQSRPPYATALKDHILVCLERV